MNLFDGKPTHIANGNQYLRNFVFYDLLYIFYDLLLFRDIPCKVLYCCKNILRKRFLRKKSICTCFNLYLFTVSSQLHSVKINIKTNCTAQEEIVAEFQLIH